MTGAADGLGAADAQHWRQLLATAGDPVRWRALDDDAPVLVDDRPALDELLLDSYVARDDPRAIVACGGVREIADAELLAYEAARREHWQGVLAAAAESRAPTAYLRQLAGDARWGMRHLHSAAAEYRAGIGLATDDATRERLERRLAGAERELGPIDAAESAARRNGWLVGLAVAAAVAAAAAVRRA